MNPKAVIPALVHWILTFFTDRLVFVHSDKTDLSNYICCKVVLLLVLFLLWSFILKVFAERDEELLKILKYSGVYLIPLILVMIFKLPQGYLSNDEALIFEEARVLADYTWFSYLTTWYYIVSLMLIPVKLAPIFVKVILQLLICGYTVKRSVDLCGRAGLLTYIPFLFYPVLAYTTSAHRIPVYFLLYSFMLIKLFFDALEEKSPSKITLLWLLLLGAVLTQWRTEGIYLLIIFQILLFIAYRDIRSVKEFLPVVLVFILMQYLVSVPQNGVIPGRMGDKANNRMAPFYAYTITNMMRNGLDRDKNKADLEKVGQYLSIEALDRINEDLKDINYEDVLILYYPGYIGVKEDVTPEDYNAYTEGCMNIFKNNPDVFLRTRAGAFNYAALPYHIGTDEGGVKGFIKLIFSIVKALFYNLYIPHILLLIGFLMGLIKKKPFLFFASAGLIGHFIIVFVLAPASYFKYYFPVYFTVYLFLTVFMERKFFDTEKVVVL